MSSTTASGPAGGCTPAAGGFGEEPLPDSELRSRVVDVATDEVILDLGERIVFGVFSPDNRYLAVVALAGDVEVLEIHDLVTRELISSRQYPTGFPFALAFDAESRLLAGGMPDGTVWVLDLAAVAAGTPPEDAVIFEKDAHNDGVVALDISGDGVLASASRGDGVIRLWDIATGDRLLELRADPGPAAYPIVQFASDDTSLLYLDGTILKRYLFDTDALIELAESRLTRGFTVDECEQYLDADRCP